MRNRNRSTPTGASTPAAAPDKDAEGLQEQYAEPAAVDPNTLEAALATIRDLEARLLKSETGRTEAEKAALAAAEAQGYLMQNDIMEVPTGRTRKVKRAVDADGAPNFKVAGYRDDGREIIKPVWRTVELPTFFYKIDMPPVGGMDMKVNGESLFQGVVYEFDIDVLRSVKEMVYRLKDHDRNIHGSDENFYRTPQERRLSGQRRGA